MYKIPRVESHSLPKVLQLLTIILLIYTHTYIHMGASIFWCKDTHRKHKDIIQSSCIILFIDLY